MRCLQPVSPSAPLYHHEPVRSIAKAEVKIQHSSLLNYWLVTITSKDRRKVRLALFTTAQTYRHTHIYV